MDGSALDLVLEDELTALESIATARGWNLTRPQPRMFHLDMPAKGGDRLYLHADVTDYPPKPPAWHWRDPATGTLDPLKHTPKGGAFFHGSGVICAPWNRLAYKDVDSRGPHSDWALAGWQLNPLTGGTRTLAAMALRIAHELEVNFSGRMG